ncbi:cell division topological specificity factor MinE [uncultured Ilyobacter sp.]|uniref:cell division topological specificity factor MinE n=1 Tax=uncultured Ilyobacter sp. TaxID=544433 RepID=UPI0029C76840|nr:cell division topological specificity factor MinE [uncultured Ilyobacter sp.]
MSFFDLFKKNGSKNVAKDRLKLVLIHDRAMLSPRVINDMKNDLITVISKYVDIDIDSLNIEILEEGNQRRKTALIASIPIKNAKC